MHNGENEGSRHYHRRGGATPTTSPLLSAIDIGWRQNNPDDPNQIVQEDAPGQLVQGGEVNLPPLELPHQVLTDHNYDSDNSDGEVPQFPAIPQDPASLVALQAFVFPHDNSRSLP